MSARCFGRRSVIQACPRFTPRTWSISVASPFRVPPIRNPSPTSPKGRLMVIRLKHRSVVFVGGGFTAALAARQLTAKGVDVVVLERGIDRTHTAATSLPSQRDELRWDVHGDLFQDWSVQTYTLRHNDVETALPI